MNVEKLFRNHVDCKNILKEDLDILYVKHAADITKEKDGESVGQPKTDELEEIHRRLRIDAMWAKAIRQRIPKLRW